MNHPQMTISPWGIWFENKHPFLLQGSNFYMDYLAYIVLNIQSRSETATAKTDVAMSLQKNLHAKL